MICEHTSKCTHKENCPHVEPHNKMTGCSNSCEISETSVVGPCVPVEDKNDRSFEF